MKKYCFIIMLICEIYAQYIIVDKEQPFNALSLSSVSINGKNAIVGSLGYSIIDGSVGMSLLKFEDTEPAVTVTTGYFPKQLNTKSISIGILLSTTIQPAISDAPFPYVNLVPGIQLMYPIKLKKIEIHPAFSYNRMLYQISSSFNYSAANNGYYQVYNWSTEKNLFGKNSFHLGLPILFKINDKKIVLSLGYKIENSPNFQVGLSILLKKQEKN